MLRNDGLLDYTDKQGDDILIMILQNDYKLDEFCSRSANCLWKIRK